jgi:hypothetical protein
VGLGKKKILWAKGFCLRDQTPKTFQKSISLNSSNNTAPTPLKTKV